MKSQNMIYAIHNEKLVHISEVESGLKCNCTCPACGEQLIARKGNKVTHHFAHNSKVECEYGYQTSLHLVAKEIISESHQIQIPPLYLTFPGTGRKLLLENEQILEVSEVILEKKINNIIPDILLKTNSGDIIVEIFVTHEINNEKKVKIKKLNIPKVPDQFGNETIFMEGKPGVGKSHFVNEIYDKFPTAIVYRFWVGSQDPNKNKRISFESFISEIGIKVYKTAKKVIINELIDDIKRKNKLLIIDGLDHVENYNPQQLEQFINFIDNLEGAKVVVLSRPLKTKITWKKIQLLDWNYDETRLYLEITHKITDYKIQNQIFHVTNGYPIVTYFVAEDYNINHIVDIEKPITGINEYYDSLFINNNKPSSAIGVFAVGNCYFTRKELKSFYSEPEIYEVICEFIEMHPYLFKILENRISLIHDSFNTYLRMKISTFERRKEKTIEVIRKSILSGSIEYMERMESFDFDDEFYKIVLLKYCDFSVFEKMIMSTNDYNSIQSFYNQLQIIVD